MLLFPCYANPLDTTDAKSYCFFINANAREVGSIHPWLHFRCRPTCASPACLWWVRNARAAARHHQVDFFVHVGISHVSDAPARGNHKQSAAGQLPALEHGEGLVDGAGDEYAAARAIIAYLRGHGSDIDAHLSATQVAARAMPHRTRLDHPFSMQGPRS